MSEPLKNKYVFHLYPFTKKYLKQFKELGQFKDYDEVFQWLICSFDKKQLRDRLNFFDRLDLLKEGIFIIPKQEGSGKK